MYKSEAMLSQKELPEVGKLVLDATRVYNEQLVLGF